MFGKKIDLIIQSSQLQNENIVHAENCWMVAGRGGSFSGIRCIESYHQNF